VKKKIVKKANADPKSALSFKAIRNEYADLGVENYYRNHGDVYENPHFPYIQQLLEQNKHRIDYSHTLDLACGGGEVTLILRGLGFDDSVGCDPFTHLLFEQNTGKKDCLTLSFDDIIKGSISNHIITQSPNHHFSSIISSFAMHLCPEKQLFPLVSQLFLWTKNIVIITPHKRPELEKLSNVTFLFEDFVLTKRGKKVFLKSYSNANFSSRMA
jgi:SAM-dependent methyltransferase